MRPKTCKSRLVQPRARLAILLLSFCWFALAQRKVQKQVLSPNCQSININANLAYQLILTSAQSNTVEVCASIEGEYEPYLSLQLQEQDQTLNICPSFLPSFEHPNDKLSAHKVTSVSLQIQVPRQVNVNVTGEDTAVKVNGFFKQLHITLNNGSCNLSAVYGKVKVYTKKGNIKVAKYHGGLIATSTYGKVVMPKNTEQNFNYNLQSTQGNITVLSND